MSAWIVSSADIDALVQGGIQFGLVTAEQDRQELGRMLWQVNHDSVNHRYGESEQVPAYRFAPAEFLLDPWALLAVVKCYRYQSCEHSEWESSEAAAYTARLIDAITAQLGVADDGNLRSNPRYRAAPWGISSLTQIAAARPAAGAAGGVAAVVGGGSTR